MSWTRYETRALADTSLRGDALHAALEDYIRVQNPQLTDVRLERATATGASGGPPGSRWYQVTYLAEDPERSA
ncbi:hypothetical protein [Mycobacterium avium]|uniref:hypothetical protein n=1 Tax=Mycobacterium avium TaxID=1764 RepID=UPI0003923F13|nr:hypothetical protein [Mycobacterium avium]ETA99662.1 hypothetical protein O982_06025 [Mycobacterium avium 10-5581]ETB49993.1 hypothetical protein O974_04855 [Mycobacterium avium 11-0986]ATO63537.1 hypothetical protein BEP52_15530 [Mycobacterium avium subsp. hominissuis]ATO68078.1 hypothetical protein BJP78_15300 [Mycobacterium avium subsp. hominissuis]ATO72624.2 hypothetical protein BJP74_15220 [Mycobacterium avium subsp. hominissuis]